MIGKIKPTITIGAEVRLIFSEIEFIECTSLILANLNGYEILIGQPIDDQDFRGKSCHLELSNRAGVAQLSAE